MWLFQELSMLTVSDIAEAQGAHMEDYGLKVVLPMAGEFNTAGIKTIADHWEQEVVIPVQAVQALAAAAAAVTAVGVMAQNRNVVLLMMMVEGLAEAEALAEAPVQAMAAPEAQEKPAGRAEQKMLIAEMQGARPILKVAVEQEARLLQPMVVPLRKLLNMDQAAAAAAAAEEVLFAVLIPVLRQVAAAGPEAALLNLSLTRI